MQTFSFHLDQDLTGKIIEVIDGLHGERAIKRHEWIEGRVEMTQSTKFIKNSKSVKDGPKDYREIGVCMIYKCPQ